ncbi:MAG: paraquat-inducible protein A [Gammaproteobacteria bacterium]|nr:paraquat-inducible protein A [Gammaproteobacteria bacterium]MCP4091485.1 paraquat-inducible protein A [Gammaproteobacteria bacterium]MCP4275395.1 paraquat-inducible protein A [Gammaproteobacteria bacterium]MCP4832283.1 paraquat-inducible protein A [Gammaproteobacteria bacterium]MCP4928142.1 paraquat-inducible protein A [Gammaproteobacteria bacterium]
MYDDAILQSVVVACPDCDLLNQVPELVPGDSAFCIRCNATLARNPKDGLERGLALTCTAAILFVVANVFPFLSFGMDGLVTHTTLVTGIVGLYNQGMVFVAAVVAVTIVIVPTLVLVGLMYLLFPLRSGRCLPGSELVIRWIIRMYAWNMVEVFMIGIVVAAVKLHTMAVLIPGLAAWSFMLLIFVFAWLSISVDVRVLWSRLEAAR